MKIAEVKQKIRDSDIQASFSPLHMPAKFYVDLTLALYSDNTGEIYLYKKVYGFKVCHPDSSHLKL